jgi:DNA polymerase-3 subunit delta'
MTRIYGHDAAADALIAAAAAGRMHHAWLLVGPQGIGKASFAFAVARRLLADAAGPSVNGPGLEVPAEHPIAHYLDAGSHPDFKRLERLPREGSSELARNINVGQVRALQPLFASTPSLSRRRVVLIDAIDDLEPSAANALLKNLEEPPADSLFLLVSHAPGRLLPTIRSRCRLLRLAPLGVADMEAVLRSAMPDADDREMAALIAIGGGAPGRALRFAGMDAGALDDTMTELIARGDPTNAVRAALARKLSTKAAQPRYEAFLARVASRIAEHARGLSGEALPVALSAWERARSLSDHAVRLSLDPQAVVFELAGLLAALAPAGVSAKA